MISLYLFFTKQVIKYPRPYLECSDELNYICQNLNKVLLSLIHFGPVAQWIEQQPSKLWVERSSRSGVTFYRDTYSLDINFPYHNPSIFSFL